METVPEEPDHDRLLRRLSAELARLHSFGDVSSYILGAVVQLLGGNTGSLCLLSRDGRELQIVAEHGYSDAVRAVWTSFRVDGPLPASEAVRTKKPVFIVSPEDRDERYPIFQEQPVVEDNAYAIEPLLASDDRVLGALVVGFERPREFSDKERDLLGAVTQRCAQALERTRLPT
jgi:GAF domain-containing protein